MTEHSYWDMRDAVMDSYPDARRAILEATGCNLPHFLHAHAVKHINDPETRRNFMFNAAISYEDGDVENLIEDEIDAYLEDCAAAHERGDHLDKLADLAANDEDRPMFRGRRKRVQVSGIPV